MSALIVMDDGSPVTGSIETSATTLVTISNFDNTGVLGWEWELTDRPAGSSATLTATTTDTTTLTPDIPGTYLVQLKTYTDAARTVFDDADVQGIGVRYLAPNTWRLPAAGETSQFDNTKGWKVEANSILDAIRTQLNATTGGTSAPAEGLSMEGIVGYVDVGSKGSYDGDGGTYRETISGGTLTMTSITTSSGHHNYNGTSSRAEFASIPTTIDDIFATGGTALFWIRVETDGAGGQGIIFSSANAGSTEGWRVEVVGETDNGVKLRMRRFTDATDMTATSFSEIVPKDEWCMVAVTYDDSAPTTAPKLWVNLSTVEQAAFTSPTGTLGSDASNATAFGSDPGGGDHFDGDIEAGLFFNRVLDRNALAQIYELFRPRLRLPPSGFAEPGYVVDGLAFHVDFGNPRCCELKDNGVIGLTPTVRDLSPTRQDGQIVTNNIHGPNRLDGHLNFPAQDYGHVHFGPLDPVLVDVWTAGGTAAMWIRPETDGEGSLARVVTTETLSPTAGWGIYTLGESGSTCSIQLQVERDTSDSFHRVDQGLTLNAWNHVVITYDSDAPGTPPVMHINGVSQAVNTVAAGSGAVDSDSGNTLFVGDLPEFAKQFDGDIEIVSLYTRALSSAEATQLFNVEAPRFGLTTGSGSSATVVSTTTQITGDISSYTYTDIDTADVVRFDIDSSDHNALSMDAPATVKLKTFVNTSTSVLSFKHEVSGEAAAEQFRTPDGKPVHLLPGQSFKAFYDDAVTKWIVPAEGLVDPHGRVGSAYRNATFLYDALDRRCYDGSATRIVELIGRDRGNFTGSPTFASGHMNFPGGTDYIDVNDNVVPSALSETFSGGGALTAVLRCETDGGGNFGIAYTTMGTEGWLLRASNEAGSNFDLEFFHRFTGDDGRWNITLELNTWYVVTVAYNDDSVANDPVFYVNGAVWAGAVTEVSTPTGTGQGNTDGATTHRIGGNGTSGWDGDVDLILVHNVAMTAAKAEQIFDAVKGPYQEGIVKLTERAGDPATIEGLAQLYAKDVAGTPQVHAKTEDGTVHQITPPGGGSAAKQGREGLIYRDCDFLMDPHDRASYDPATSLTTATDVMGIAGSGTMTSVTTTSGQFNFDGAASNIDFGTLPAALEDVFGSNGSVSGWFRAETDGENNLGTVITTLGATGWGVRSTNEAASLVDIEFIMDFDTTPGQWVIEDVPVNVWHHFAITYNSGSVANNPTMYLNGQSRAVVESVTPVGTALTDSGNSLYVGNNSSGTTTFDGDVGLLMLHPGVNLTQAKVQQLYEATKAPYRDGSVDLVDLGGDPVTTIHMAKLYSKDVSGTPQVHAKTEDGTVHQLTPPGAGGGSTAPSEGLVQNGLVFQTDPLNYESYTGVGSTDLKDVISGDTGTISLTVPPTLHMNFDGSGDSVDFTTVPTAAVDIFNNSGGGTVQAWVRIAGPGESSQGYILDTTNNLSEGWALRLATATSGSTLGERIVFEADHDTGDHTRDTVYEPMSIGEWVLVTVVYDGSGGNEAALYVNNNLPQANSAGSPVGNVTSDSGNPLTIGNRGGGGRSFDGDIGPCLMYDRPLTRDEIAHNYEILAKRYGLPDRTLPDGIPQENLQLFIDYGNPASFTQQGTRVSDLSPNKLHGVAGGTHSIDNSHYNLAGTGTAATHINKPTALDDVFEGNGATLHAWFRADTDGEGANGGRIITTESAFVADGWCLHMFDNGGPPYDVRFRQNRATADGAWGLEDLITDGDTWVLVSVVYDADDVANDPTMYVNGVASAVTELVTPVGAVSSDAGNPFIIGDLPASALMFDGDLEIFALYDTQQSAEEVKQFYRETKDRFTDSLTAVPTTFEPGEGIVQKDLVLCVDPFDQEGFDGTNLYNLAGTNGESAPVSLAVDPAPYLNFNGSTDNASFDPIPAAAADIFLNTGGGTVIVWARAETIGQSSNGHILDTTENSGTNGWSIAVVGITRTSGFRLEFEARHASGSDMTYAATYEAMPINEWVQIAVVYDGTSGNQPTVYVNNGLPVFVDGAATTDSMGSDAAQKLSIGERGDGGRRWDGDIGMIAMYSRPLSREEIVHNYNVMSPQYVQPVRELPPGMPLQNLQFYVDYHDPKCFNQVASIVRDLSPNRFDGIAGFGFDTTTAANRGHYNLSGDGTTISATWFDRAPELSGLFNGGGTAAFWCRPESVGETAGQIVSTFSSTGGGWVFQMFPANSIEFRPIRSTSSQWNFNDIVYDEWVCIMLSYDSSGSGVPVTEDATGYINGQPYPVVETVAGSGALTAESDDHMTIGERVDTGRMFAGDIGLVALWDRELTAHEAQIFFELTRHNYSVPPRPLKPAQITANTNDWEPVGWSRTVEKIYFSTSASRDITGLDAINNIIPDGWVVELVNTGSNDGVIKDEDVLSSVANRFAATTGADLTCPGGGIVRLIRDAPNARWRAALL